MTPDVFRTALDSLRNWWRPGRVIGIIGGEPTLNKHFAEICRIFRDEFNPGALKLARKPIRDFNAYAHERLFDRTNGKGLWTSFGPKFTDHYELISETFSHWNPNDHSTGEGVHQTSLVDAREMCDALGIDWSEWPIYRDACWLQNTWSAAILPSGLAYFCERAGHLDALYNEGKLGWDVKDEPDWWKRTPDQFGSQLSICEMCSMALDGPGQIDVLDRDIIGKRHVERLIQIGSPAVKGGRYDAFDPSSVQQRHIDRKDNYVAPSGVRVGADNPYVYGKSVACVTVCVGRAAHLAQTLPRNAQHVDEMIVVTTSYDEDTQEIVKACAGARLVISDACHEGYDSFNKGRMINAGLKAIAKPDWIILTDADVFLSHDTKGFLKEYVLNPGVLYGTFRSDLRDANEVRQFVAGSLVPSPPTGAVNMEPNGYFHLFNRRASAIASRWPAVMSESFCSAGGIDSWFMQQWPREKLCMVGPLSVAHIAHAKQFGDGWNAPAIAPAGQWRQMGMLTATGFYRTDTMPLRKPVKMRLTDTVRGSQWTGILTDGRIPPDVVQAKDGDLVFLGVPLGGRHVHVAWWTQEVR